MPNRPFVVTQPSRQIAPHRDSCSRLQKFLKTPSRSGRSGRERYASERGWAWARMSVRNLLPGAKRRLPWNQSPARPALTVTLTRFRQALCLHAGEQNREGTLPLLVSLAALLADAPPLLICALVAPVEDRAGSMFRNELVPGVVILAGEFASPRSISHGRSARCRSTRAGTASPVWSTPSPSPATAK
jgi:hypothetical protein